MRIRGYFYPTELALSAYLIITGLLIILHFSLLPNAGAQLAFRVLVMAMLVILAWLQHKRISPKLIEFTRFILPLVLLTYLYTETNTLNNFLFINDLDPLFSGIEEQLFGFQPALVFAQVIPSNGFAELMYFGYFSYYLMLVSVPLYVFIKGDKNHASRVMFIVIHSFFVYYLIFILIPVGGPQFYFSDWPDLPGGYIFGPLMRFIQLNGEAPTAAFPSSHASICIMLILLCFRFAKPLLKIILPVAVLLLLSTVYIRAHYLIDVLGAFLTTPLIYKLSDLLFDKISKENKSFLL